MIQYTFTGEDWLVMLFKLSLATLIGGTIGRERYGEHKPAGMRTHILVCLGAAIFVMIPLQDPKLMTPSQIIQGVAQGIGFLGAGVILHQSSPRDPRDIQIRGLTSAAAIWATSALGVAIGVGIYPLALLGAFFVLFTLKLLARFEP